MCVSPLKGILLIGQLLPFILMAIWRHTPNYQEWRTHSQMCTDESRQRQVELDSVKYVEKEKTVWRSCIPLQVKDTDVPPSSPAAVPVMPHAGLLGLGLSLSVSIFDDAPQRLIKYSYSNYFPSIYPSSIGVAIWIFINKIIMWVPQWLGRKQRSKTLRTKYNVSRVLQ